MKTLHSPLRSATISSTYLIYSMAFGLLAVGCVQETVVGDAADDGSGGSSSGQSTAPVDPPAPYVGSGPCASEDEDSHHNYETWRRQPNEFGVFAATTWEGYVDGGPDVRLVIEANHQARLEVGEPVWPTDKDAGYLCDSSVGHCTVRSLLEGGTYPIYGALTTGDRVELPIHSGSAFAAFCALQTPVLDEEPLNPACGYFPAANAATGPGSSPELCMVGDEEVLCAWLTLVNTDYVCACASDECFPGVGTGQGDLAMDITYDEVRDKFEGTVDGRRVLFSRSE